MDELEQLKLLLGNQDQSPSMSYLLDNKDDDLGAAMPMSSPMPASAGGAKPMPAMAQAPAAPMSSAAAPPVPVDGLRSLYQGRRAEVNSKYDDAISRAKKDLIDSSNTEEKNPWTQVMLALAPGLLGSVTGSAGAKAALPTMQASQELQATMSRDEEKKSDRKRQLAQIALGDLEKQKNTDLGDVHDEVGFEQSDRARDAASKDRAESRSDRKEAAQANRDLRQTIADQGAENRASAGDEKLVGKLNEHLDKGWLGRGGQASKIQEKINNAEATEGLIEQGKHQKGGLDSRQIEELAQSTARTLGGTGQASARVEALVPHTVGGKVRSFQEWITGKPTGLEMQEFTDRMAETIDREKKIANNQRRSFQVEGLTAFAQLKKRNPEAYNAALAARGISPEMIDENGRYNAPKEFPLNLTKVVDGVPHTATVNSADELKEAQVEGWK